MENGILTAEEIEKGNALIARFDGYELVRIGYYGGYDETEWQRINEKWSDDVGLNEIGDYFVNVTENKWFEAEKIKYNCDYNSLMPILEKISKLKIKGYTPYFEITNYGCTIDLSKSAFDLVFTGCHGKDLITNIWIMIVEFLDWYVGYDKIFN